MELQRAQLLFERNRFPEAADAVRQVLASDPDNGLAHAMLALCLVQQKQLKEAQREAEIAVGLAPEHPFAFHAIAAVAMEQGRYDKAREAIDEMIRIDPSDAHHFMLLALVHSNLAQWAEMLHAAETGLRLDSEHVQCTNLRAFALRKLGRRDEARTHLDASLALDPENADTHTVLGWQRLEAGDTKGALVAFREALRLDPEHGWAQEGIVEALKARHAIYRVFLGYAFRMSRLSGRAQFAVLVGGYVLYRVVFSLRASHPSWSIWLSPLLGIYIAFVLLTWIGRPLFDLLLLLHPIGRHALPRKRIAGAVIIGILLFGTLTGIATALLATGSAADVGLMFAVMLGTLIIPTAGFLNATKPQERWIIGTLLGVQVALGLAILLGAPVIDVWLICVVAAPWVVNIAAVRDR